MEHASDLVVLERIKIASGATQDNELGLLLGLSKQSITKARTTNSVPTSWVPKAAQLFNVSTDWLFFGSGPMRRDDATDPHMQPTQAPQGMPVEQTEQPACPRCAKLEQKLELLEQERREIAQENRQLWKENKDLSVENAVLKASSKKQADNVDYQPSDRVA